MQMDRFSLGTMLAKLLFMRSLVISLLLLFGGGPVWAINESISLTDAVGRDSVTVRVGETLEIQVRIDSNGTAISGFQCFLHVDDMVAEPVPFNDGPTGLFHNNALFPGDVYFADNHDVRFPNDPLPGHQLDWCYQTAVANPRPAYQVNGTACSFRLRFLQQTQFTLGFDHDNGHFRNTLYWEGQSAVEHGFYRENGIHFNVIGMDFGPLPDLYLTTDSPCDSLDLTSFVGGLESVHPDSLWFTWAALGGPNTTCTTDSTRAPGQFWLRACGTGPDRQVDLVVTAHALNLSAVDTLRVLRGDPPIIDDGMAGGDPFVSWLEDEENSVDLDPWVTDLDDPVADLRWSLLPGSYTVVATVDTLLRRAHFTAPQDWFGLDTLFFRVVDPGGMADTSRMIARVLPVNDPPAIDLPLLLQVHPGQPLVLDLESITSDVDDIYDNLFWQVEGDTTTIAMRVHPILHTLTLEVQDDAVLWTFVEGNLRVTDLGGLSAEDSLHLQVASHPPLWTELGDLLLPAGSSRTLPLNDLVSDADNSDAELVLSLLDMQHVQVVVDASSHVATFTAPSSFTGLEILRAHARDPQGNTDTDTLRVAVVQGGNPLVALVPDLIFLPGARDTLQMDDYVWDQDTADGDMSWTVDNSGLFVTQVDNALRRVMYTAPALPGSVDQSIYRATDLQGHWGEDAGSLAVIDPSGIPLILPMAERWLRVNAADSSLSLDDVVYDYDHEPFELTWEVAAGNLVETSLRATDRRLFLQAGMTPGTENIALTVTDPSGRSATGALVVHVTEGNAPVVSAFAPRFVIAGQVDTLRNLSNWVYDPDPGDQINWTFIDPANAPVRADWLPALDAATLEADSLFRGTVTVGAAARDMAQNSDVEWISLTVLENESPVLASAVLANPGEPRQLDLAVTSNEALRSLVARRQGDGTRLTLSETVVANPVLRLYRTDLPFPSGTERWVLEARDLPAYPQVEGNAATDTLVLGGAVLGGPGDGLSSPDGGLHLSWVSGLSNGSWLVQEVRAQASITQWVLHGPRAARARADAPGHGLQRLEGGVWVDLPAADALVEPGDRLRRSAALEQDPQAFTLYPASPNPFNASTVLRFTVVEGGRAQLTIFDVAGHRVRSLWLGPLESGSHQVRWDGLDDRGHAVASGLYLVHLRQGAAEAVQKVTVLK